MPLAFLSGRSRPGLHESGAAPLGEPDVDDIEVPWDDRVGKDLPRLACDLGAEVAVRQVGERQHADAGRMGQLGRCGARRVGRLGRPLALLRGEGGLVHEHVRVPGHVEDRAGGSRVAGKDDLAPRPRRTEDLLRRNRPPVLQLDRLAVLKAPV
jgi:hypothetical protein